MQRVCSISRVVARVPLRFTAVNAASRRMLSTSSVPAMRVGTTAPRAAASFPTLMAAPRPLTVSFTQLRSFADFQERNQDYRGFDPALAQERAEKKTRTIYVGNLAPSTTEDQVHSLFSSLGNVNEVHLQWADRENGLHRGYGFVEFATAEEAQNIAQKKDLQLENNTLLVNMLGKRVRDVENTIHVGNLPFNVNKEELQALFQTCGEIVHVRIPIFQDTGRTRGFGYIKFANAEAKNSAMAMSGPELGGRVLRVSEAVVRSEDERAGTRPNRRYDNNSRFGGGERNYEGGERSYERRGNRYGGGERSYGGGERSYGGGERSYGGGERSYGGGERSYGGGRGRGSRNDFQEEEENF